MLIGKTLTTFRCQKRLLDLSSPVVAGIINVTPDSFFGPRFQGSALGEITDFAEKMVRDGALILDVGGMSSRPGAEEISASEELDRVVPVVENLASTLPEVIISVDTYRSGVAEAALKAGASIINDISGGSLDPDLHNVVKKYSAGYVLMHMRGKPENMQNFTDYQDIISDILKYFVNKLRDLHLVGIRDIIIDPGFGFSKTIEQNYKLIEHLSAFGLFTHPLMVGVSRKSTLSTTIRGKAEDTLAATTALHMAALQNGASILRVHDVKPAMDVIAVYNKLREAKNH